MLKPFYISSFGGTATMWINKVLNTHPQIVSYHGTRSIPPYDSGTNDMAPENFAKGLVVSMENSNNTKVFGAIHGYYGLTLQQAINDVDGIFCAVIRSPIKRINSLFNHHYKNYLKTGELAWDNDVSVYQDFVNKGFDQITIDSNESVKTTHAVNIFSWICNGTIGHDAELIEAIGEELNFKMESLVKDKAYLNHFLDVIGQNQLDVSQDYLDQVMGLSNVNKHAHVEENEQDIFNQWPDVFKLIYKNTIISNGGTKVFENYQKFDYQLVDNLTDDFAINNNRFTQV